MPLVESCLPEEVLVAWERSRNHQTESEGSRSLEQLMNFLRQEVKGEEMVLLARTSVTLHQNPRKKDYHATQVNKVETTTTAALLNMDNPGISSPTEIEKQKTELSLNDFNNKRKILPDGRYEELPWKYNSLKLPSNKELGTNLIELIPDILDRFRMYPIGISADIEKAFLMPSVAPKDRDFLRFFPRVVKGGSCIGTAELCFGFLLALFC
ncbi:uncharacterized protein TNCV_2700561 [Trichonephila clavipes]|nr:uncharacterized protein TNCV_2700561 [Trichonephila clavipes]